MLLATALAAAVAVAVVAFARVRGRWLFAWLATCVRYATRRHVLPAQATPAGLAAFLAPDLATTDEGAFVDADGMVVVFELEEPIAGPGSALPDVEVLLDGLRAHDIPASAAHDGRETVLRDGLEAAISGHGAEAGGRLSARGTPVVCIELLVTVARAPTARQEGTAAAASYRRLTGDRVLTLRRTFVVLRVGRPVGRSDGDLRPTVARVARRVGKRLGPHRRLGSDDALATVAELVHHDGRSAVDERWAHITIGGLCQAGYRLRTADGDRLVREVLALPAAATTVVVGKADGLAIRLAAESPRHLAQADRALRHLAAVEGATLERRDGDHRFAMAETLPFAGHSRSLGLGSIVARAGAWSSPRPAETPSASGRAGGLSAAEAPTPSAPGRAGGLSSAEAPTPSAPGRNGGRSAAEAARVREPAPLPGQVQPGRPRPRPRPPRRHPVAPNSRDTLVSQPLPSAGMVLGYDRHGAPIVVRLHRVGGTRIVVVAGLATAQVLALRGLALGARLDVRTRRWAAWHGFAEEAAGAVDTVTVTPDAAPLQHWPAPGNASAYAARPHGTASGPAEGATPMHPRLTVLDVSTRRRTPGSPNVAVCDAPTASPFGTNAAAATASAVMSANATAARSTAGAIPARGHPPAGVGGVAVSRRRAGRRHILELDGPDDYGHDPPATDDERPEPVGERWHTVVAVRDELVEGDAQLLAEADLVIMRTTLSPDEAALAADALRIHDAADWLVRGRGDVVAVVSAGAVRWAAVRTTPIERALTETRNR
ncbi:hypothetical protein [Asanoa siamensis]|nr:hypothetical protein [Asanoa siamensis]